MTQNFALALFVALATSACGKDSKSSPPAKAEKEAYEVTMARRTLDDAKKALAEHKPADMTVMSSSCRSTIETIAGTAPTDNPVFTEIKEVCGKQLNLAVIESEVVRAEQARKAQPDAVLMECHSTVYDVTRAALEKAGFAGADKDLVARFTAVCPASK